MLFFGITAYATVESKRKIWAYVLWGVSNIYWSVVAYGKQEKILALVMIIYTGFCIYNIFKNIK